VIFLYKNYVHRAQELLMPTAPWATSRIFWGKLLTSKKKMS